MDTEDSTDIVMSNLQEILLEAYEREQLQLPPLDESTRLIGRKAVLDSLGLVTLIVNIEQELSENYRISVTIADERALTREKSPFRTVGSLSKYISLLIEEQRQHVPS